MHPLFDINTAATTVINGSLGYQEKLQLFSKPDKSLTCTASYNLASREIYMPQAKFAVTLRLKLSDKKEEMGGAPKAQFQTLSLSNTYTELLQEISTPEKGLTFVWECMYIIKIYGYEHNRTPKK